MRFLMGGHVCVCPLFLYNNKVEMEVVMANYHKLSNELQQQILEDKKQHKENPYACKDEDIIRRDMEHDKANIWRPAFVRDIEKILHNPYYNRYSDKTQVFSFYKNDDISRRALHVQLVARIARNIGAALNLNESLIEAISLGHDIGHTPFGHAGERMLNTLYYEHTGRFFNHNVHSVRVLDKLVHRNISLQVLDGVLCHNGEMELEEYKPAPMGDFVAFDKRVEDCYCKEEANRAQIPCTLEGCVMRVSDIIAYLGKDRQDAMRLGIVSGDGVFSNAAIGTSNAEIINNMIVNLIENSYGKPYLSMSPEYFDAFKMAKKENYALIYGNDWLEDIYQNTIKPMFKMVYEQLLRLALTAQRLAENIDGNNEELIQALLKSCGNNVVVKQYLSYIAEVNRYSRIFDLRGYLLSDANDIVTDYIASMTDDYFIDLFAWLFPDSALQVQYRGYFDN